MAMKNRFFLATDAVKEREPLKVEETRNIRHPNGAQATRSISQTYEPSMVDREELEGTEGTENEGGVTGGKNIEKKDKNTNSDASPSKSANDAWKGRALDNASQRRKAKDVSPPVPAIKRIETPLYDNQPSMATSANSALPIQRSNDGSFSASDAWNGRIR